MSYLSIFLITLLAIFGFPVAVSSEMSSTNYHIYADSLESGGGLMTGGDYSLQSTFGENSSGIVSSTAYEIKAGYQYMELGTMSMDISPATINLGNLTTDAVSEDSSVITVSTDSNTGYSLSVSAVSGTSVTAVADGSVTAGEEEYGVAGSGDDNLLSGDNALAASLAVAASSTAVTGSATTLTFRASVAAGTTAGSRSQTVTFVMVSNF